MRARASRAAHGWLASVSLTATARDDKAFMQAGAEELISCWMASLAAPH
jgi:hypothetical protein